MCCVRGPVDVLVPSIQLTTAYPLLALMAREDRVNSSPNCEHRGLLSVLSRQAAVSVGGRERESHAATVGRRAAP